MALYLFFLFLTNLILLAGFLIICWALFCPFKCFEYVGCFKVNFYQRWSYGILRLSWKQDPLSIINTSSFLRVSSVHGWLRSLGVGPQWKTCLFFWRKFAIFLWGGPYRQNSTNLYDNFISCKKTVICLMKVIPYYLALSYMHGLC